MASCNHFYTIYVPFHKNELKFGGAAWVGVVLKVQRWWGVGEIP